MKPPKREVSLIDLAFHDRWKAEKNADERLEKERKRYDEYLEREGKKRREEEARRVRAEQKAAHAENVLKAEEHDREGAAAAAAAAQPAHSTSDDSPYDIETATNFFRFLVACFVLWVFTTTVGRFLLIPFALYLFFTREGRARIVRALGAGVGCGALAGLWWGLLEIAPWDSAMTTSDGLTLMGTFAAIGLGAGLTWPKSALGPEPLTGMASYDSQEEGVDEVSSPQDSGADNTMGLDLALGKRT